MRNTLKTIILLLLLSSNGLYAQSFLAELKGKMDSVFQYVNRSRVETGILSDYGYHQVNPAAFNGIPSDTNYVTMDTWKYLYLGMYTSQFNSKSALEAPATFCAKVDASTSPAVICLQYNKLDDDAVTKGLLRVENEQIKEVAGVASPYFTRMLFAVAPQESVFRNGSVSFFFDKKLLVTNIGSRIGKLEVNFDGGSGYKTVVWGTPLMYSYFSGGEKTVCFRLSLTDGSVLTSRTKIRVEDRRLAPAPGTEPIREYVIPPTDQHSGGSVQYIHAKYNSTGSFMRPLIIAEDMDFRGLIGGERMTLELLMGNENIAQLNELFDLVYIWNKDGLDSISCNAKYFEAAMDEINSHRNPLCDPNHVIGIGMGGLVARYGLSAMEKKGKNHRVSKFISLNAPHKGLNFPLGFQMAIRFGYKLDKNFSLGKMSFSSAIDFFDSDAMKQMMIYGIDGNYNYINNHTAFMRDYEAMGFPKQCRNIAVSSGSTTGGRLFLPGSPLLELNDNKAVLKTWQSIVAAFFLSGAYAKIEMTANALSHKNAINIFKGKCALQVIVLAIPIKINKGKASLDSRSDMLAVDGAPGTYLSLTKFLGDDNSGILKQKKFCIVPTVSALAINSWEDRMYAYLDPKNENSGFDQLYADRQNYDYENQEAFKEYLMRELAPQISGNGNNMAGPTEFSLNNLPSFFKNVPSQLIRVEWLLSNDNFKVASSSGTKAMIAPVIFLKNATLKARISISSLGIAYESLPVSLNSIEFNLTGSEFISPVERRYSVNFVPSGSTLTWSLAPNLETVEQKDNYIVIKDNSDRSLSNPLWIQANLNSYGTTVSRKLNLKRARVEKAELECVENIIVRHNGERKRKFVFRARTYPSDIPVEEIRKYCWSSSAYDTSMAGLASLPLLRLDMSSNPSACLDDYAWPGTKPLDPFRRLPVLDPIFDESDENLPPDYVRVLVPSCEYGDSIIGKVKVSVYDNYKDVTKADAPVWNSHNYIIVYSPNPASTVLNVSWENSDNELQGRSRMASAPITVCLYNDLGLVRTVEGDVSQSVQMSVVDLPNGMYYLNIVKEGEVVERQVVMIRH